MNRRVLSIVGGAALVGCIALQSFGQVAPLAECHPRSGLPNVLAKLHEGKPVRVAYLGGSITAASGWRAQSLTWLQEKFPSAKLSQINAAIPGTGAELGVSRLQKDVLDKKPDLIFVEFAVNGAGPGQRAIRTMEGIVRQAKRLIPDVDVCFVYTVSEAHLETVQSEQYIEVVRQMETVAEHYGVPSIYLGLEPARMAARGELIFKGKKNEAPTGKMVFSEDGTHPLEETGHRLYMAAIERSFPLIERASGTSGAKPLPESLDSHNWEWAKLVPIANVVRSGDWRVVSPTELPAKGAGKAIDSLMVAGDPGASFTFEFSGTAFGLYALKGPDACNFTVTIDRGVPIQGSMFDSTCVTDRWRPWRWFCPQDLPPGKHVVKVEISAVAPDKSAILAKVGNKINNPEQLAATRLYMGYVIVVESGKEGAATP